MKALTPFKRRGGGGRPSRWELDIAEAKADPGEWYVVECESAGVAGNCKRTMHLRGAARAHVVTVGPDVVEVWFMFGEVPS